MDPLDRTLEDRWADVERFLEVDCESDEPGPRLVEAMEVLVDDWWSVSAEVLSKEMERRPTLKTVVLASWFDERVPHAVRDRLYQIAAEGASGSIFVYGTLMPGETRWGSLRPFAIGWEPATTEGQLWDTGMGYPAARFSSRSSSIGGFLVALDPDRAGEAVSILDEIEGEGTLFRRLEIVTSNGPAITYEWLGSTEGFTRLANGWPPGP